MLTFDSQPVFDGTSNGHVLVVTPGFDLSGLEDASGVPARSLLVSFYSSTLTGTAADTFTSTGTLNEWFADDLPLVMPPVWTYFGPVPMPFMLAVVRSLAADRAAARKASAL